MFRCECLVSYKSIRIGVFLLFLCTYTVATPRVLPQFAIRSGGVLNSDLGFDFLGQYVYVHTHTQFEHSLSHLGTQLP